LRGVTRQAPGEKGKTPISAPARKKGRDLGETPDAEREGITSPIFNKGSREWERGNIYHRAPQRSKTLHIVAGERQVRVVELIWGERSPGGRATARFQQYLRKGASPPFFTRTRVHLREGTRFERETASSGKGIGGKKRQPLLRARSHNKRLGTFWKKRHH